MIMRGLTIKGVIVGSRRMLEDLVATAAFDHALEATRYMASGQKIGKVMIEIGGQDA